MWPILLPLGLIGLGVAAFRFDDTFGKKMLSEKFNAPRPLPTKGRVRQLSQAAQVAQAPTKSGRIYL